MFAHNFANILGHLITMISPKPIQNVVRGPVFKLAMGFSVLATLALAGCATRMETRGNELRPNQVNAVQQGPYTRERIIEVLGSPSSVSTFDNKTWYYIFERTETMTFFDRDLRERLIVTIQFDDAGRVINVKTTGEESAKSITPNENKTPTAGNRLNFIEQMIANLGRFNTE